MKTKIDIGNRSAINANNNGTDSSMSPINSESGSHDSSHLDLLSPLAKSDKLLKVMERAEDECSFCAEIRPVEHLHYILSGQQIVDPTIIPELIDVTNVCYSCGRKSGDMKLCSQCRGATYCDRNCQSSHWRRHRIDCRPDSSEFLSLNSTLNSSKPMNGEVSKIERNAESLKTVSKTTELSASEKVVPNTAPQKITRTTPQIVNTVRNIPKESTPILTDTRGSGDHSEVKSIQKEPELPKPKESIPPKEVIKTAATKEIPNEKVVPEANKTKVKPTVEYEVLNDGEVNVVVCFGRNPFDFYLQKASAVNQMDVFVNEIEKKMNDFPQLSDEDLRKGALCGGIYSLDGQCYRARIVDKLKDNTYALYFIDYGNTEPVEKKDIKRLPEIFFSCKAQAIHCSLDKMVPKNNVWSKDAINLFGDLGESNEYAKVKIFKKTDEGVFKIDLLNRKGESIRNRFFEKGYATEGDELSESRSNAMKTPPPVQKKVPQTPVKSDSPVIVQGSPKVTFNKSSIDEIAVNYVQPLSTRRPIFKERVEVALKSYIETLETHSKLELMITNVYNPEELQYFATIFDSDITELMGGLAKDYEKGGKVISPQIDDIVVVKGSDDDNYRSYVLDVELKAVKVFMIDSGVVERVARDRVYKMEDKYKDIPVYGVMLLPDTKVGARLIELSQTNESTIDGVLLRRDGRSFIRIDDIIIEMLDYKSFIPFVKSAEDVLSSEEESKGGDPYSDLPLRQLEVKKPLEAFALYQDTSDDKIFYVAGNADELPKLMEMCANYSNEFDDNIRVNPLPGNVYLVRSSADNEWYRAVTYSVKADKVQVKYIDFGNEEEVDIKYFMELSGELTISAIPPLSIKCKVDSTKLSPEELTRKIQNATEGTYLLKMKVLRIEDGFHFVKVK